ncbi:hypothetical protein [Tianweitania sediminis]|uniref:Uncharacterized protein n=1 Tax=Tianweitania sediminis TaxID=1502156 RepID=A0A8J7R0Y0_9HYPH|nr:hypothetical protein [Tianweitania sediminis]MBP0438160.1 hypothetical protein [Tianweitania sediminis]HEV7417404.1 hypothetical protein [Tianweitania sediminis]
MEKKVQPEKARQGKLGRPVLLVLVCALVLLAIAWFIAEQYGQAIDDSTMNNGAEPTTQTEPAGNADVIN